MAERMMGGVSIQEYRELMKADIDELLIRNDSTDIDEDVAQMRGSITPTSSVDPKEYEGLLS